MTQSDLDTVRILRKRIESLINTNAQVLDHIAAGGHSPSRALASMSLTGLQFEADRLYTLEGTMGLYLLEADQSAAGIAV